ncbi:hypothetical protein [Leptospira sp. 'Mane']|uniref:hypothetical protein n=1 Tax=Leptospira sp. 'Mane' TaxID=3387407 RepID=UPI00398B6EC6
MTTITSILTKHSFSELDAKAFEKEIDRKVSDALASNEFKFDKEVLRPMQSEQLGIRVEIRLLAGRIDLLVGKIDLLAERMHQTNQIMNASFEVEDERLESMQRQTISRFEPLEKIIRTQFLFGNLINGTILAVILLGLAKLFSI